MSNTCPRCRQPVMPNAKFCGDCGVPLPATPPPLYGLPVQVRTTSMACPNCASENIQSIQILIQAGTTRGSAQTGGIGVGLGGGVGLGAATTTFSSQSDLAKKYVLGGYPSRSLFIIVVIFMVVFALNYVSTLGHSKEFWFWFIGASVLLAAIYLGLGPSTKRRQEEWRQRKKYLSMAWFCHRCGLDWVPAVNG